MVKFPIYDIKVILSEVFPSISRIDYYSTNGLVIVGSENYKIKLHWLIDYIQLRFLVL